MSYWESPGAQLLLKPRNGLSPECFLVDQIRLFDEAINKPSALLKFVDKAEEKGCELKYEDGVIIYNKILYLRNAYVHAVNRMTHREKSWSECCDLAIEQLKSLGLNVIKSKRTLMTWHRYFRAHGKFPYPSSHIEYLSDS